MKAKILILLLVLLICPNYNRLYTKKEINFIPYTVSQGETLWDIAKRIDGDPREIVHLIREKNNISPLIRAGQTILIPEVE